MQEQKGLTKHQQERLIEFAEELGGKKPDFCLLYRDKTDGSYKFEFNGDLAVLFGLLSGAAKIVGDKFAEIVNRPRGTQAGIVPKPFVPEIAGN